MPDTQSFRTYSAKPDGQNKRWVLVDAENKVLGRFATEIAKVLRGKNNPHYTPHVDTGDYVVVVNADKISVTGDKEQKKFYYRNTQYPGGARFVRYDEMMKKFPERIIEHAVKGMLPKGNLGRAMYRKLKVYSGSEHPHENIVATGRRKTSVARVFMKLGSGFTSINGKKVDDYFSTDVNRQKVLGALVLTESLKRFDIKALVFGGGITGQAGALRLAIARALVEYDETLKLVLRKNGYLTRDPRMVERKKYGQKKAQCTVALVFERKSVRDDVEVKANTKLLWQAGAHFGHIARRWDAKMKPYIYMEKNGVHIIDLKKTIVLAEEAFNAAENVAGRAKNILFVGTKKQAKSIIQEQALRAKMPYVSERWLGGMLTNFSTIRQSVRRLNNIRKMKFEDSFSLITKKERLMIEREEEKLLRMLGGIAEMTRLPSAIFIVDIRKEHIAVKEAKILGIPIFAIVDTNCDPNNVTYPIPANDDSIRSVELITSVFADAIINATTAQSENLPEEKVDETRNEGKNKNREGDRERGRFRKHSTQRNDGARPKDTPKKEDVVE
ncbi:hypothetical protein CHS0354_000801 [Potamilus streckersoni]|uniref:Large ribosomal subunit protein uL13c n=1 Tax=Potamilus streckersoni TaxID=2493646 RepID=A0AAE0W989_9BIVA|nr:hypothetical protein CHS0354_000801 [Potamilus streckersoni]